jgi:hypothetical protein
MLRAEIKILDYYFFSIGVVSVFSTFFLFANNSDIWSPLLGMLAGIFILTFLISVMLNMIFFKKIREMYIFSMREYIVPHTGLAAIVAVMSSLFFFSMRNIAPVLDFVTYFVLINLFMMVGMLLYVIGKNMAMLQHI